LLFLLFPAAAAVQFHTRRMAMQSQYLICSLPVSSSPPTRAYAATFARSKIELLMMDLTHSLTHPCTRFFARTLPRLTILDKLFRIEILNKLKRRPTKVLNFPNHNIKVRKNEGSDQLFFFCTSSQVGDVRTRNLALATSTKIFHGLVKCLVHWWTNPGANL
jgi:hypothetical protein